MPVSRGSAYFQQDTHDELIHRIVDNDIVVIPSLSFDSKQLGKIKGIHHYEERMLFNILSLRHKNNRVFYFTSVPVDTTIIDYYISLLPPYVDKTEAKSRLFLLTPDDNSTFCLAHKILLRPLLLEELVKQLRLDKVHLQVFRGTLYEQKIAKLLGGLKINTTKPSDLYWGGKAGSRFIFKELDIAHPDGTYFAERDLDSLFEYIINVLERNPSAERGVLKLDEGFAGKGNALLNVKNVQKVLHAKSFTESRQAALAALKEAYQEIAPCCAKETLEKFTQGIKQLGAIFELFNETKHTSSATVQTSPSVQVSVEGDGKIIVLSTHEQVLTGQEYTGCLYPCSSDYRHILIDYGRKVGEFLANKGISDHFSVDFMCDPPVSTTAKWDIKAVEINLRITGTTHPFMMASHLIAGATTEEKTATSDPTLPTLDNFCYVSSDSIKDQVFQHLTAKDVINALQENNIAWDPVTRKGAALHLLGLVSQVGGFGVTCIGSTNEEVERMYAKVFHIVKQKGERAKSLSLVDNDDEEVFA